MFLKACLNGARRPDEHPALPLTPAQLAADGDAALAAGADGLHVHVRAGTGEESLAGDDVAATLDAIRARCGNVPLGISTGAWIEPDLDRRLAQIRGWSVLPDFCSLNFSENGAEAIGATLLEREIGIEAGLATVSDVGVLARSGLRGRLLRVLIEVPGETAAAALTTASAVEQALDAVGIAASRLLHGENAAFWPVLDRAVERGYASRVGLEDVLHLPDGSPAPDNAALVRAARERARSAAPSR